ncbi:MAG: hypothetical protein AB1468_02870, partial [Candidatus Micrarchaeota archaeon]
VWAMRAKKDVPVLTFNNFLSPNNPMPFLSILQSLFKRLEQECGIPVDIEFAIGSRNGEGGKWNGILNLLQVRPAAMNQHVRVELPKQAPKEQTILSSAATMGNGEIKIRDIILVLPEEYKKAEYPSRVAMAIGKINERTREGYLLVLPGRCGTTTAQLGVPTAFAQISNMKALAEFSALGMTPELSFGTHFFGDFIQHGVLYMAVEPEKERKEKDVLNFDWFRTQKNNYTGEYDNVVKHVKLEKPATVIVKSTPEERKGLVYL